MMELFYSNHNFLHFFHDSVTFPFATRPNAGSRVWILISISTRAICIFMMCLRSEREKRIWLNFSACKNIVMLSLALRTERSNCLHKWKECVLHVHISFIAQAYRGGRLNGTSRARSTENHSNGNKYTTIWSTERERIMYAISTKEVINFWSILNRPISHFLHVHNFPPPPSTYTLWERKNC